MKRTIRYETLIAKTVLNPVKAPSMPFGWSINPYRGCQHGCSFCYARSTHAFLGLDADDTFQNRIMIKGNAREALARQLKRMTPARLASLRAGHVVIGTATDPYQQAEKDAKLTRGCLELLVEYGIPASVTTRSPLVLRDLDLLKKLPGGSVNISVGTLDPAIWRAFEPSTPSPAKRMETLQGLRSAGITAGVFIAPILPYISDHPEKICELMAKAVKAGASFVMTSFLRLSTPEVKSWFMQTLSFHYPHLKRAYETLYASSGTVPDSYKEPLSANYRDIRKRLGLQDGGGSGPVGNTAPPPGRQPKPPAATESVEQLSFPF